MRRTQGEKKKTRGRKSEVGDVREKKKAVKELVSSESYWESGCDNAGFRRAPAPWIELEAGSLIDGGG